MSSNQLYNFAGGPATLPEEVCQNVAGAIQRKADTLSLLEIGHRTPQFADFLNEAQERLRQLLKVPESHHILFMHGGASLHFAMLPLNRLASRAAYIDTGYWSQKAMAEASRVGSVDTAYSAKETGYDHTPNPDQISSEPGADYLHLTSNNTIYGTQYRTFPTADVPLVADMSSDILSRPIDVSRFDLIYAGAQKNLGAAGVALAIISDRFAADAVRDLPRFLTYKAHVAAGSVYNTPPVTAIFTTLCYLRWVNQQGGLQAMESKLQDRASRVYAVVDRYECYTGRAAQQSRSRTNITFTLPDEDITSRFLSGAQEIGCVGLKGHRAVGGIRVSLYNGMSDRGVDTLEQFMSHFAERL